MLVEATLTFGDLSLAPFPEVTARELQRAIRDGDESCVAQIVIQSRSVKGIEEGFRIPPEFNFLQNFGKRERDPDVAAIRGLSLGILQGDKDRDLVDRLVEGIVPSFTPRPGELKSQPFFPGSHRPTECAAISIPA